MREWPAQRLSESEARQMEAMATLGRVMCIFISRTSDVVSGDTLQCVAVCCSVLQCVAVCCSVLQCVAVCCRGHGHFGPCDVHLHISSF